MEVGTIYIVTSIVALIVSLVVLVFGFSLLPNMKPLPTFWQYVIIFAGSIVVYLSFVFVSPEIGDELDSNSLNRLTTDRVATNIFFMCLGVIVGSIVRYTSISPKRRKKKIEQNQ